MNKKLILIPLSVVMFSTVSFAQKVIKNGSAVIIDCSGMSPKFYSNTKIYPTTTTATNSTNSTNGADISSWQSNAKVYKKFEVYKTTNNGSNAASWNTSITICSNLYVNGYGGWRLPTQRELMLIWILKDKLAKNGVSGFEPYPYWSATGAGSDLAYSLTFSSGRSVYELKTNLHYIRCVKDLD